MDNLKLPPNIENYAKVAADLQNRDRLSAEQKKKLAICKLKIALWSCKAEGIPLTRYALAEILGPDTSYVFEHAQTALVEIQWESEEDRKAMKNIVDSYKNRGKKNTSSGGGGGGQSSIGIYR